MDISKLQTSATATCVIKHPVTGEDTDIKITVYGFDSKEFRTISLARAKKAVDGAEISSEEYLASITISWENVDLNGKPLKFTPENAVTVYETSAPIRNQVDAFVMKTANFLTNA